MHVLDHVSISVPDITVARPFYDEVMDALGVAKVYDRPDALGYGVRCNADEDFHSCLAVYQSSQANLDPARHWCFNPNNPLGRYPAMKNTPRSGQNQAVVPIAWGFLIIWIPAFAGMTQFFSNELFGFKAGSRAHMREFYARGLANGGKDDGLPGIRHQYHPHYYGAFLFAPFLGNRVEAVCHRAEAV